MTADVTVGEAPVDVEKPAADDARYWSVTTIIKALDKSALEYWAAKETAKAAVKIAGSLPTRIAEDGEDEVVKWLSGARYRRPQGQRSATELGTAVHDACEQYALTGERPDVDDEIRPYLDQFDRWAQRWQPEYEAAEMTVYNETYGYAGQADAVLRLLGMRLIGDYKSTRKARDSRGKPTTPYPEVALQLAAYRHAELAAIWRPRRYEQFRRRYYLLGADERELAVPVPEVEGGVAIHITPEHCVAYPVRCDETIFQAFLFTLEAARWQYETSRSVIGAPLVKEDA